MKRILSALLFLGCSTANAQFVTGQILTAAQLNAAFANVLSLSGGTLTGPLTVQGSTTLANLTVNGTFTVPGGFSPGSLSPQAANSLLGNASSATAAPSVVAVPSCSTSTSALQWTSGTGFNCYANSATTTGTLAQFAATTSAQLAGVISDETGTGSAVFGTSPTIATPAITGGTINNAAVGATTASTGAFTTLSASGAVSGSGFTSLLSPYAPLASAALTGTPTAPTPASSSNNTLVATTAFVQSNFAAPQIPYGSATPNAVSATTLSATSTVSGAGFTALLSPYLIPPSATTSYTPTVTASSGTFTTTSATGHYYVMGKLVFFEFSATITTVGSATGNVLVSLPFATNSGGGVIMFAGQETAVNGKTLQGSIGANSTSVTVRYYDASSAIAAGLTLVMSGCYVSN